MYAEATYKVKATGWSITETTNGNPRFEMIFDVLGVGNENNPDAEPKPCEPGTGRWSISPTTPNAQRWLVSTVRHLGYDREDIIGLDPEADDAFDFEGLEFLARVKHKEYQGQLREDWTVVLPRPRLASSKLEELNEAFASTFREAKERETVRKAAAKTGAAEEGKKTGKVSKAQSGSSKLSTQKPAF